MNAQKYALGVDLGGTKIRVARISNEGKIIQRTINKVPKGRNAQLEIIFDTIQNLVMDDITGVGLGFPGRVNVRDGVALTAGYLELKDVPLGKLIFEKTGKPTFIDTDADMALFAEYKLGSAQGYQNIAMMTIGTGIGGAIILDGKMFYGNGSAAQLGHIAVKMEGSICNCGRKGCIETLSSGTSLRGLIKNAGMNEDVLAEDLISAARNGEQKSLTILSEWVNPLKVAIDNLFATLSPEIVLLGGGLGKAAYDSLQIIKPKDSPWFPTLVKAGALGDDAGVIGSGLCALEKFSA